MTRLRYQCALLLVVFSATVTGCHGPTLRNSAGKRLHLADYDSVTLRPVEVGPDVSDHPGLSEDLAAQIHDRLSHSTWVEVPSAAAGAIDAEVSGRQIDLTVRIVKARYPSRSKIIWLGASHKMTCRLEIHDHTGGDQLGSGTVSTSVEPLMGNAALLNFGWLGIAGRAIVDTRKRDADLLLSRMARDIIKALDRARD